MNDLQRVVDERNRAFWDELCGSWFAQTLGIDEITPASLERFDDAYLRFYPYLARYLERLDVKGRETLEIGLGFGTVGQSLATRGARYHGADIAAGPVAMMRDRLRWLGKPADDKVVEASALDLPWKPEAFDLVVSIGCLHHTGDLPRAVAEVHRVLKPGGTAFVMLYNARSLRQFVVRAYQQLHRWRTRRNSAEQLRAIYDTNSAGEAAPHTDFVSRREVRQLFGAYSSVSVEAQNFDQEMAVGFGRRVLIPRHLLLGNVARVAGLDLYIHARK